MAQKNETEKKSLLLNSKESWMARIRALRSNNDTGKGVTPTSLGELADSTGALAAIYIIQSSVDSDGNVTHHMSDGTTKSGGRF